MMLTALMNSSEISNTINNLLKQSLSPEVREEDMDGAVKQSVADV